VGVLGSAIEKTGRGLESGLPRAFSKTTKVDPEALVAASSKTGRDALKANFGKQYDVGQNLVKYIDNENFGKELIPERSTRANALNLMPDIDVKNAVDALESSKVTRESGRLYPWEEKANAKIDELKNTLLNDVNKSQPQESHILDSFGKKIVSEAPPAKTTVNPWEFIDLREGLDKKIKWDDETKEIVEHALKNARETMKDDLISTARRTGNKQYEAAMSDMAEKLQARENILDLLGRNNTTRENRAQSFIDNLYGTGKNRIQDRLKELDRLMGTDFAEKAKMADLADSFGKENKGVPGIFSQGETGKYAQMPMLGALGYGAISLNPAIIGGSLLGLSASSPKVATRVIAGARGLKNLGAKIGNAGETLGKTRLPGAPLVTHMSEEVGPVYHGGPHNFDNFGPLENVARTGEGNQAFGYGHYLTNDRDVADYYRKNISSNKNNNKIQDIDNKIAVNRQMIENFDNGKYDLSYDNDTKNKLIQDTKNELDNLVKNKKNIEDAGYVYEAIINKGEKHNFLKWDTSLAKEDLEKLKKYLIESGDVRYKSMISELETLNPSDVDGESLYKGLANELKSKKQVGFDHEDNLPLFDNGYEQASSILKNAGFDGIDYPTGSLSKSSGVIFKNNKSRNYVVFDPAGISIESRNGIKTNHVLGLAKK
jgi:hypothetical protein